MTKFEEEAKKEFINCGIIANSYSSFDSVPERAFEKGLVLKAGFLAYHLPWLEFAKNWHPDEEFQELSEKLDDTIDALDIARNSRDEFEREYKNLKSQIQQQALPVVPECVGMAIKQFKNDQLSLYGSLNAILSDRTTEIYAWISRGNQNAFALAFITGKYEVEKPQLFYLKHIDMSKADKELDYYLAKEEDGTLSHDMPNKGRFPWHPESRFTQQEIDSMETGSYEQIEVVE